MYQQECEFLKESQLNLIFVFEGVAWPYYEHFQKKKIDIKMRANLIWSNTFSTNSVIYPHSVLN